MKVVVLDAGGKRVDIERVVAEGEPVVLRGYCATWRACKRWTLEFFSNGAIAEAKLPVSLSNEEQERNTRKVDMTLRDYVLRLQHNATSSVGYLKQFDLLGLCPALHDDIDLGPFASARWGTTWAWLGGRGAVTGLHNDDENNILYQVMGQKTVTLFPHACRGSLYPTRKYDPGTECCAVDPACPNAHAHPLFCREAVQAAAVRVTLCAGDALYIPRFVYHHVACDSVSISVNHFASTTAELLRFGLPRLALEVLHRVGLYCNGYCVCHARRAPSSRQRARATVLTAAALAVVAGAALG
eukprot:g5588.t1